jgi:hypothetical protein
MNAGEKAALVFVILLLLASFAMSVSALVLQSKSNTKKVASGDNCRVCESSDTIEANHGVCPDGWTYYECRQNGFCCKD